MGLVLIAGLFAGCLLGLMVTALMGGAGVALTIKNAKTRTRVWWCFAAVFMILLLLGIVAVHEYPYASVRPGSDYGLAMKNFFLQGFGYCASAGPASLLAAVATCLMPRKPTTTTLVSNRITGANHGQR
jgi:hypothetical protein